ncbi:hypothetical protein HanRHA438_Chr05g0212021 [Helianthus annuus]|nr:hypothetical protein HanRHA438_Chr05g0212021 [Helianthus annuus]
MNTRRCRRPFESDSGSNGYPMEAYYYRRPFESVSSGDDLQISSWGDHEVVKVESLHVRNSNIKI